MGYDLRYRFLSQLRCCRRPSKAWTHDDPTIASLLPRAMLILTGDGWFISSGASVSCYPSHTRDLQAPNQGTLSLLIIIPGMMTSLAADASEKPVSYHTERFVRSSVRLVGSISHL